MSGSLLVLFHQVLRLHEHALRISPLTLVPGATYTFTCTATNPSGIGSASVQVTTIPEPSGRFGSSPFSGTIDIRNLDLVADSVTCLFLIGPPHFSYIAYFRG